MSPITGTTENYEITLASAGHRIDSYIAERCGISRARVQKLLHDDQVMVNGLQVKASYKLNIGDRVVVSLPPPAPTGLVPENIPLNIIYEDSDVLVIDKPAGLVVHPAAGHCTGTLVHALIAYCPELGSLDGSVRPGIVHRLDKDTSGLMMVAKNSAAQANLSRQIKERSITKAYDALVEGHLTPEQGAIEAPIGRSLRNRKRMAVVSEGREARTQYRVVKYINAYTLLEATPETGRTHQIRVHFSAIGHSIFGDPVYGRRSPLLKRQFLHACLLGFKLPSSSEYMEFVSELPPDLREALEHLTAGGVS